MRELDIVIQLSDVYERANAEGGLVATAIDREVIPYLAEVKAGIGLGARFDRVIEKVRASASRAGKDRIRTLKDMLRSALGDYVRKTGDAMTARDVYHRAIMSGSDMMLTCTAGAILANALHGQHANEAKSLLQQIASRLSGRQPAAAMESSGSAVGSGAVATRGGRKKRRRDSIFAEGLAWNDLLGLPVNLEILREIQETGVAKRHQGILVDPTTAELVLSVHHSIPAQNRHRFASKSIAEMIGIAHRCVQRGLIQVCLEQA